MKKNLHLNQIFSSFRPIFDFELSRKMSQAEPARLGLITSNKHLSLLYFCLCCCYFSSVSHFKRVILRFTSYYHSNCYFEWSVSSDYSGPFSVPTQQKTCLFTFNLLKYILLVIFK